MIRMFVLVFFTLIVFVSCASKPNIQRECKAIGDGGFYECEKYPWYKRQCERYE